MTITPTTILDHDLIPMREFFTRYPISKSSFYRAFAARSNTPLPTTFTIGKRRYISLRAAQEWVEMLQQVGEP